MKFETKHLPARLDYLAPDGSEIRLLSGMNGGGLCHCTMSPGRMSIAVTHKTVEEIWYFIQGRGQVWRQLGDRGKEVGVKPGDCLTIPVGTHFQFRNTGREPLRFIIATMTPWPGKDEAVPVPNRWSTMKPSTSDKQNLKTNQQPKKALTGNPSRR